MESAASSYLTFISAWCSRRNSELLLSCRCMAMCSRVCPSDMVSLMEAPEPSSWAAIVCMPGKETSPDVIHAQRFPLPQHLTTTDIPSQLLKASSFPLDLTGLTQTERLFHNQMISSLSSFFLAPSLPPSPASDSCQSADMSGPGTALPVHNARPSTVWSRESLRLKSGMICKLLVA